MILYDAMGRPVDVRRMVEYYSQQAAITQPQAINDIKPPPAIPPSNDEWTLKPQQEVPAIQNTPLNKDGIYFQQITEEINIQAIGNKEARLGDTLLFYNPETGELYKKYVDFMTGQLHIESAKFTTGQVATPLITVDKLHDMVIALSKDVEEMKGVILDVDSNDDT